MSDTALTLQTRQKLTSRFVMGSSASHCGSICTREETRVSLHISNTSETSTLLAVIEELGMTTICSNARHAQKHKQETTDIVH